MEDLGVISAISKLDVKGGGQPFPEEWDREGILASDYLSQGNACDGDCVLFMVEHGQQ